MSKTDLHKQKCVPCEGGTEPFDQEDINKYSAMLKQKWEVVDGVKLSHAFKFNDFVSAMAFANTIAEIAEQEGHHPDLHIYYGKVRVELTTHAIKGLSINDFVLASKIERINTSS